MSRARHTGGVGSILTAKRGRSPENVQAAAYDVPTFMPKVNLTALSGLASGQFRYGIFIKPDGTKLFAAHGGSIVEFRFNEPFNVQTLEYVSAVALPGFTQAVGFALEFSPDGSNLYISQAHGQFRQYSLSSPWDISTAVAVGGSILITNIAASGNTVLGLRFNSTGTKALIAGWTSGGSQASRWVNLATPWALASWTAGGALDANQMTSANCGVLFAPTGARSIVYSSVGRIASAVLAPVFPSTGNISNTITYSGTFPIIHTPCSFAWGLDGKQLFILTIEDASLYVLDGT